MHNDNKDDRNVNAAEEQNDEKILHDANKTLGSDAQSETNDSPLAEETSHDLTLEDSSAELTLEHSPTEFSEEETELTLEETAQELSNEYSSPDLTLEDSLAVHNDNKDDRNVDAAEEQNDEKILHDENKTLGSDAQSGTNDSPLAEETSHDLTLEDSSAELTLEDSPAEFSEEETELTLEEAAPGLSNEYSSPDLTLEDSLAELKPEDSSPEHSAEKKEMPDLSNKDPFNNEEETQENTMQEQSQNYVIQEQPDENFNQENLIPDHNLQRDTIFGEEDSDKAALAEINFDLVDAGRWLLKVISGPNHGAEFSMHSASSYVIGTDPTSCDIVFHDTSVSRQHARVTLASDDGMSIEDLKSRNQTLIDGEPVKSKTKLLPNSVVTVGTTSFTIYDREGEMQTIISPLMPAIVKVLQKEEPPKPVTPPSNALAEPVAAPIVVEPPPVTIEPIKPSPEKAAHALGAFIVMGIITGLFAIIGLGTAALFRSEPVVLEHDVNTTAILADALRPFPSITPYFNKSTGTLQLIGHVLTQADKQRLFYSLQGLPFIKNVDDSGVIIDEYVWQETNAVLSKDPAWKGIYVQSPSPGKYILSGYLQTRNQADQLSEYITNNFLYLDLLERRIVVEEDVVNKANNILSNAGFRDIAIKMEAGDLTLTGGFPNDKEESLQNTIEELRKIPGVRNIKNLTAKLAPDQSIINISDKYEVTGFSRRGATYSIVVHGRILTVGDEIDGMQITEIRPNAVMLEKDNVKYRIDFSR